ncbi:MAG: biotin--[acetyl-CoA-carboxylase] ligase [Prolixibacteraceae bacterium]|nr:biotin--[acetyl-CoA-carboxylase] ligase [Prolixibacteraceae bacterium]
MSDIIGKNTIKLDLTDSTNNYAIKNLDMGKWAEGTVVMARGQTAGRGQTNNRWESEYGKNLLLSIVFYPRFLPVQQQFLLSKIVALGISDTLSLYVENVSIKWPNDIWVSNLKIAGILIENTIMGNGIRSSVAGTGINLNQKKFTGNAPNPVSLIQLLKKPVDCEEFALLLFSNIEKWYKMLMNGETKIIDLTYLKNLYLIDEEAFFSDNKRKFKGKIIGVGNTGQLLIERKNGIISQYHFKEVEFLL